MQAFLLHGIKGHVGNPETGLWMDIQDLPVLFFSIAFLTLSRSDFSSFSHLMADLFSCFAMNFRLNTCSSSLSPTAGRAAAGGSQHAWCVCAGS